MAKIYDVYDDFNEEMKNISHFFNLNYNEKKISNEEFIFNFLEQQLAEQKIANCVNSLKEQNKISKKDENQKKDECQQLAKVNSDAKNVKKDKKTIKTNGDLKKESKIAKTDIENKPENVETPLQKEEKVISEVKENIISAPKEFVKNEKNQKKIINKEKIIEDADVVKDSCEKTVKQFRIKKENIETQEKIITFVKNDREIDFERKYLQNGKYVIEGVNVGTSVFGKKIVKVNTIEKNSEERSKDFEKKNPVVPEVTKNKKFKIDCNIDQNLLNGCYWPTQLS